MTASALPGAVPQELMDIFGDRVAFHKLERQLYARDMGVLPGLLSLTLDTLPQAVVQPTSLEELEALMALAQKHHIPLVPRGSGTAGYGGAVPARGGIVVDFFRMGSILNIDGAGLKATVEPGARWQQLEDELRRQGLALRLYPTSAISATVAGWIANGGEVGVGSFQYAYLKDNILEVELATPQGVRTLRGKELELVSGLAGSTGFITKATVLLRRATEDVPRLASFADLDGFVSAVAEIGARSLPLWHVSYLDARHAALSRQAVERQVARDHIHRDQLDIPELPSEGILGLFVGTADVMTQVSAIVAACGGHLQGEKAAGYIWEERFYPMRLKALGPSLIPSEVVVPSAQLPELVARLRRKLGWNLTFDGTLVWGGREAILLTYMLDDERRLGFTLAYPLSLVTVADAKKLGGRAYTVGMFFNQEAENYFGKERLARLYQFKKDVDPDGILNPGKVFPPWLDKGSPLSRVNFLIKLGQTSGGLLRLVRGLLPYKPPTSVPDAESALARQHLGEELGWDAYACAGCGYCRSVCTEFNVVGWESASPRGKFHFLRHRMKNQARLDERMADMFFMCATCRRCDPICQARIPILQHFDMTMRPVLWEEGYNLPLHFKGATENVIAQHNPMGHPHEKRTEFLAPDIKYRTRGEVGYWVGCTASYAMKPLAENPLRILNAAGLEPVLFLEDEWCCGCDMMLYGRFDDILDTVAHNIEAMKRRGVKTLIVHCPGCWSSFALYYPILAQRLKTPYVIEVEHITETMARLVEEGRIRFTRPLNIKVTYHDSCHLGRRGGIFVAPRRILEAIPGVELVEMPQKLEDAPCCGRQLFAYTDEGPKPYVDRAVEAQGTGAAALVTNCPGCQVAYILGAREAEADIQCLDITDLVAMAMGIPVREAKVIARMARQAYDQRTKVKIAQERGRARIFFAPHQESYQALPGEQRNWNKPAQDE